MENNELQKIWRSVDSEINRKSKDELDLLLISKAKQTMNKLIIMNVVAILICIGMLIWLIFTSLNRLGDEMYLMNNTFLGIIIFISLFYGLWFWHKFQRNKFNQPLIDWLAERIDLLSKWLKGSFRKPEFYLFPLLYILTFLSIHVYYSGMNFMEVFESEKFLNEDIWGMILFTPVILALGFYYMIKTRKYYLKKIEFLKDLYGRLRNVH